MGRGPPGMTTSSGQWTLPLCWKDITLVPPQFFMSVSWSPRDTGCCIFLVPELRLVEIKRIII